MQNPPITSLTNLRELDILRYGLAGRDGMQFDQLNRREFVTFLGGTATAWPLAARAQQPNRVRRIGALMGTRPQYEP